MWAHFLRNCCCHNHLIDSTLSFLIDSVECKGQPLYMYVSVRLSKKSQKRVKLMWAPGPESCLRSLTKSRAWSRSWSLTSMALDVSLSIRPWFLRDFRVEWFSLRYASNRGVFLLRTRLSSMSIFQLLSATNLSWKINLEGVYLQCFPQKPHVWHHPPMHAKVTLPHECKLTTFESNSDSPF